MAGKVVTRAAVRKYIFGVVIDRVQDVDRPPPVKRMPGSDRLQLESLLPVGRAILQMLQQPEFKRLTADRAALANAMAWLEGYAVAVRLEDTLDLHRDTLTLRDLTLRDVTLTPLDGEEPLMDA